MKRHQNTDLPDRYGPCAVITGAAGGIGAGFATELASRGLDLVLTDINGSLLESTAARIRAQTGRNVRIVVIDMASTDAAQQLVRAVGDDDVGLFICNHLLGTRSGQFLDGDVSDYAAEIDVNIRAYVALAHTFGNRLRSQRRGGLILISSMTGVVGSPYVATYGSAKAYILALGSALAYELRESGVDVLTLVPGAVNTETYQRAQKDDVSSFPPMEVPIFVNDALAVLGSKMVHVPGRQNALTMVALGRLLPRRVAVRLMGRSLEKLIDPIKAAN
jgi:short-subunit dehydrogenase